MTRLRMLLSASVVSVFTKFNKTPKPKYVLEPIGTDHEDHDLWLFKEADTVKCETRNLKNEMGLLASKLTTLRETLSFMNGVTPFPAHKVTQKPCTKQLYDSDLFDGEDMFDLAHQDTVVGGAPEFLFEQESYVEQERRAA